MSVRFLIVAEDTPETTRMLTMLGLMDNTKVVQLASFAGHVLGMHERAYAQGIRSVKERVPEIKQDLEQSANLKPELVGQMWQLAKRDGVYWDDLEAILTGNWNLQVNERAINIIPVSCGNFTQLGGLSDDVCVDLLRRVVNNEWKLSMMNKMAKQAKITLRVKAESVDFMECTNYIDSKAPPKLAAKARKDYLVSRWNDLEEQFPAFNDTFLETWTAGFSQVLQCHPVPENSKREISKISQKSKEEKLAGIVVDTSHQNNVIHITHLPHMNSPAKRSCCAAWAHTGCL
jgi:hypothetical protein